MTNTNAKILPGFRLSLGYTLFYLSALVLIPLAMVYSQAANLSWSEFWEVVTTERALAAYGLTFGASAIAAAINALLGLLVAWVLVRYEFPGRRICDALVDLPLALPTAVAGLVYASLYAKDGWLGQYLVPLGIHGAYSRLGVVLVLVFTGFPFVVRTVQPVLESLDPETEEAAATLGAHRLQTLWRVLMPQLWPALITGTALSFARALGEYGSVIFISGNKRFSTEIAPLLIVECLEQPDPDFSEAAALAVVLLTMSFVMLAAINFLERWSRTDGT